jgi:hypothetical protein
MNCSRCGSIFKDTDKFCSECGNERSENIIKNNTDEIHIKNKCIGCGFENLVNSNYCEQCGILLNHKEVIKEINVIIDQIKVESESIKSEVNTEVADYKRTTTLFTKEFLIASLLLGLGVLFYQSTKVPEVKLANYSTSFNGISLGDDAKKFEHFENEQDKFNAEEYGIIKTSKGLMVSSSYSNDPDGIISSIYYDCNTKGKLNASLDGVGCNSTLQDLKNNYIGFKKYCDRDGDMSLYFKGNSFISYSGKEMKVSVFGLVKDRRDLIEATPYSDGYIECTNRK